MYRLLGSARLKDGGRLEIGVVEAPDAEHAEEISSFLGHKGGLWEWHIERAVAGPLDDLETRFYVGKFEGGVVSQIMTVESGGVGILGHVFTEPENRRRGACQAVMEAQMSDFEGRGGQALYLGTGFDSPPYHIYKRNGFRSVYPRQGFMSYFADAHFDKRHFTAREASARHVRWGDWGPLTALTGMLKGDWLRSVLWRIEGPSNFEGGFLELKKRLEDENDSLQARILETADGARVGAASLAPHPVWRGRQMLDVLCHPNFWEQAPALIDALGEGGAVHAYADEASEAKIAALKRAGFKAEARLPRRCRRRLRPDWTPRPDWDGMLDEAAEEDAPLDAIALIRD